MAFSLKSKITMRHVRNRGFKHCGNTEQSSVLACGFREVRDAIMVWIVDGRRATVKRSYLLEQLGLITCGVRGIGQEAKLLGARAEVRLTGAFGSGKARQRLCGRECGVEMTVREQQGRRVKHENGEGEMEIDGVRMQQTPFFTTLSHACMCTRMRDVRMYAAQCRKNARATEECVYIPCRTHGSCHYLGAKPSEVPHVVCARLLHEKKKNAAHLQVHVHQ